MSDENVCGHCRFNHKGFCRRFPPAASVKWDGEAAWRWPKMEFRQWCGEFKVKSELKKEPACPDY